MIECNEYIEIDNRKIYKMMSKDFLKLEILIPYDQRIRDDDKVKEIVNYQMEQLKSIGWCNFMGLINIHYCSETSEMYLVDGQHRYEAIRKINETNNIPVTFEVISVKSMDDVKQNYKLINKNTPLPDFPENIDKNIPEDVAKYFKMTYPNIWSKTSRGRRPNIYFNYFQEALGYLVEQLDIKDKETLINFVDERNNSLSKWPQENYPDCKIISEMMVKKCIECKFYLGLYKHVSDDFRYGWVKDIIHHKTGRVYKKSSAIKKKTISKTLKNTIWDKNVGKKKRSAYCICCVNELIKVENFDAGHIISEHDGGKTNDTNLLPICSTCNKSMGIMNMGSFILDNFPNNYKDYENRKYSFEPKSTLFSFF